MRYKSVIIKKSNVAVPFGDARNLNLLPMVHDSSLMSNDEVKLSVMSSPKSATLNFLRQFARTYVNVQGCAFGSLILN